MLKKNIAKFLTLFAPSLLIAIRSYKESLSLSKPPTLITKGFNFTGNAAMMSGDFEPGETAIFEKVLEQVDIVVNVGYYSCLALHANKRVVAFEPMPKNVQALLANICANNWGSRAEIFPVALSEKTGVLEIFGEGTGASLIKGWAGVEAGKVTLIPVSTLDVALGNRLAGSKCLLMVDIEGAEYQFLEGAKNFLNMSPKPICFMEISIRAQQPKGVRINPKLLQTFEVFWSKGYKAYTTHNSNRLVTRDEVQAIINGGPDTLYGDTFLFLDEDIHKNPI
jgi:FkbM family methyltransferase